MIEKLDGTHEIVNYKKNTNIRLYDNIEYEEYPDHWHSSLEIVMPIKGIYRVQCSNKEIVLRENDILIVCPGTIHHYYACRGERLIFQIDFNVIHHIRSLESVMSMISPLYLISPEDQPGIHSQINKMLKEIMEIYDTDELMSEAQIYAKMIDVFVLIGRNYAAGSVSADVNTLKKKEYSDKFMNICDYINTHCSENLTLEETSSSAGFSKFYFSRLFQQFTGITFYKYVGQSRIIYAKKLLLDPEKTITDVALTSGFSSISAFNRMFRNLTGYTPSEFRLMFRT